MGKFELKISSDGKNYDMVFNGMVDEMTDGVANVCLVDDDVTDIILTAAAKVLHDLGHRKAARKVAEIVEDRRITNHVRQN